MFYYKINIVVLPYLQGMFQGPQWMSETLDSTELYIYCVVFCMDIPGIKFNL